MFHQSIKLCPRMFEAHLCTWWQNSILAFPLVLSWLGVLHSFFCDINRLIHLLIRQQNWLRSIQKDFICQFQKHTIKLIGRSFIMQQDKDPRTHWRDNKGVHRELKWSVLNWPCQCPNFSSPAEGETDSWKKLHCKLGKVSQKKKTRVWWCQWVTGAMHPLLAKEFKVNTDSYSI